MKRTWLGRSVLPVGLAWGLWAEIISSRHGHLTTYAGASGWASAAELVAGSGLIAAGFETWRRRPALPVGPLTLAAGIAWFAPDLIGWEGGPAIVRSMGMAVTGLWFALLVHAALVFPYRRLPSLATRIVVFGVYAESALVDAGRALFRNPYEAVDCWDNCTDNSFLVDARPSAARALDWIDLRFAVVLAASLLALATWRLVVATAPARRLLAPILTASAAVALLHAAHAIAVLHAPLEAPADRSFMTIFILQALAVSAVAFALAWELVRAHRARRAVEQLATELGRAPEPGSLQTMLARATGDPSLEIAYRLLEVDEYVDGRGRPVDAARSSPARAVTPIMHDGRRVALLAHDRVALDGTFHDEIGAAARIAFENERLRALTLAQLNELRASRARIVATSDDVRRSLERDLHDGAQQRLVALSFGLRVALAELGQDADVRVAGPLADAGRALDGALRAVREVANGLFPTALANAGLAYAIEELAELALIRVEIEALPDRRFPPSVEAAAYGVIREAVENATLHADVPSVRVSVIWREGAVIVEAADDGIGGAKPDRGVGLLDVADRVGALGGSFRLTSPIGGGTRVQAEIPCA